MKIKYLLWGGAGGLLLLLLIVLLPVDAELDAEAAAWGKAANDTSDVADNGYYYLLGIMASPDEDPAVAGKALLEAYLRAEQEFLAGRTEQFTAPEYPAEKSLPNISGDIYCRIQEPSCFARFSAKPEALRRELKTHAVLRDRYLRLLEFAELKPLTQPTFYERIPPYRHVIDGHRVNQLAIIAEHLSGNRTEALAMLRREMEQLRRHMSSARSLLGKMVMLSIYANNLDLLPNITTPADAQPLPALTADERSLRTQLAREFGSILNFHRHLEEHPSSFEETIDSSYGWLLRATIRPNMSANAMFPYFREIAAMSTADALAFRHHVEAGIPAFEPEFNLRNIGGSYLNSIAAPSLVPYISRLHDVDCKITLVNATLPLDEAAWTEILNGGRLAVSNPYNPQEQPYLDRAAQALCFNGPFPDPNRNRCVTKPKRQPPKEVKPNKQPAKATKAARQPAKGVKPKGSKR